MPGAPWPPGTNVDGRFLPGGGRVTPGGVNRNIGAEVARTMRCIDPSAVSSLVVLPDRDAPDPVCAFLLRLLHSVHRLRPSESPRIFSRVVDALDAETIRPACRALRGPCRVPGDEGSLPSHQRRRQVPRQQANEGGDGQPPLSGVFLWGRYVTRGTSFRVERVSKEGGTTRRCAAGRGAVRGGPRKTARM